VSVSVERLQYADHRDKARRGIKCSVACTDPTSGGKPCSKLALYRINQRPMCRRHAGSVVLDLLSVEAEPETEFWGS